MNRRAFFAYKNISTDASLVTEQVIREYIMSLQERGKYTVVSKEDTKKWKISIYKTSNKGKKGTTR